MAERMPAPDETSPIAAPAAPPLRLIYLMSHPGQNGVTASGAGQIRELAARGHRIALLHRPDAWIAAQPFPDAVRRLPLGMGVRLLDRGGIRDLLAFVADWRPDLVYSQGTTADRLGALLYRRRAAATATKAAARVWHPHWRFHDGVIAPSRATADWYVRRGLVRRDRIHLVPNFVREVETVPITPETRAAARAELGLPARAFALVILGDISHRKNQSAGLPLLAELVRAGIDAHLTLIGGRDRTETPRAEAAAARLGLADRLHFAGKRTDARRLLPAFDAMVLTSRDEQDPVVVVEAMAIGLPVLATPVGSVPDRLAPGEFGAIWSWRDPAAGAAWLARLATDPGHAATEHENGLARYATRFRSGPLVDRLEAAFRSIAAKGAARLAR